MAHLSWAVTRLELFPMFLLETYGSSVEEKSERYM